jgi:hypothetical protein
VSDPFENGPIVFRPRSNAQAINVGAIVFFLVFILLCWSLVVFAGERSRGFFVGFALFGTVAFGGLMSMFVAALRESREPIELSQEGVRANGRFVRWDAIQSAEEETRTDKVVVVRAQGGAPLILRTSLYEDGGELGRLVRAQVRPSPWDEAEKVYRSKGRTAMVLVCVFYLAVSAALSWAQWDAPMKPHALLHPRWIPLLPIPLLIYGLIDGLTQVVRLTPTAVTVGSVFRRRSALLSSIEAVEESSTGLTVRSGDRTINIRKGFEGLEEIRDRLRTVVGQPLAAPRPTVAGEVTEFPPSRWGWIAPLAMGLFILSFGLPGVVMGLVTMGDRPGAGLGLATISLVPAFLGFAGLSYAVEARTGYVLDEDGIERKAVYKPRRLHWRDVEGAWREGSTLGGICLQTATDGLSIAPDFVQNGAALIKAIEARVSEARERAIRTAEGKSFGPDAGWKLMAGFLIGMGLLMLGMAVPAFNGSMGRGRPDDASAGVILGFLFAGMGLFLIVLAIASLGKRFVPRADGLEIVTLRRTRLVPWSEFTRAESSIQRGKSTRVLLTLEHPGGAVRINTAMTGEFDRLRGAILAHLDPGIVRVEE